MALYYNAYEIIEETEGIVNAIYDDIWESDDERTGALIDWVDSWDWICL